VENRITVRTMKRILIVLILLIFQAGFMTLSAREPHKWMGVSEQTPEQEILSMMKSREASIKEVLGEGDVTYTDRQRERLQVLINEIIDFTEMSKTALSIHWTELSAAQKSEFVSLFSQVVKKSSLKKLDIFHAVIEYKTVKVEGEKAFAQTVATYKRTRTAVDYEFHRVNSTWKVTDFLIDEVSTAESYKRSFQKIIRKHNFQGLMDRLKEKLEEE
jgi:phospholipid transport system substrate-binding protein